MALRKNKGRISIEAVKVFHADDEALAALKS